MLRLVSAPSVMLWAVCFEAAPLAELLWTLCAWLIFVTGLAHRQGYQLPRPLAAGRLVLCRPQPLRLSPATGRAPVYPNGLGPCVSSAASSGTAAATGLAAAALGPGTCASSSSE